jgi:hypothetical protein
MSSRSLDKIKQDLIYSLRGIEYDTIINETGRIEEKLQKAEEYLHEWRINYPQSTKDKEKPHVENGRIKGFLDSL